MSNKTMTFALEAREPGGPSGRAVVCPDARYASAQWQGSDRPTRLHLAPSEWRDVTAEMELIGEGVFINEKFTLARLVTEGRALLRCVSVTDLEKDPLAMAASLDALLVGREVRQP